MGFSLPTVEKFIFFLPLEDGGIYLGYFTAILAAIGLLSITITFFIGVIGSNAAMGVFVVFIIVSLIYILYLCVVFYASIELVKGTRNKEPARMKLYLILMAIGIILSFLQIATVGVLGILYAFLIAILFGYFFICIYSLYKSLE